MRWKNSCDGDAGLRDIADLLRPESPAVRPRGGRRRSNAAGTGPQRGPERGPDVDPSPSSCGGTGQKAESKTLCRRHTVVSCSPPSWAVRYCTRYEVSCKAIQDPSTVGSAGTGSGAGAQTPGISAASLPWASCICLLSRILLSRPRHTVVRGTEALLGRPSLPNLVSAIPGRSHLFSPRRSEYLSSCRNYWGSPCFGSEHEKYIFLYLGRVRGWCTALLRSPPRAVLCVLVPPRKHFQRWKRWVGCNGKSQDQKWDWPQSQNCQHPSQAQLLPSPSAAECTLAGYSTSSKMKFWAPLAILTALGSQS
jgi:hypothetical protein